MANPTTASSAGAPPPKRSFSLRSRAVRGVLYQILALAVIGLAVWFLAMAASGLSHISDDPGIVGIATDVVLETTLPTAHLDDVAAVAAMLKRAAIPVADVCE